MHQLDQQVIEAGRRSAVIFEFGPPPPPGFGPPRRDAGRRRSGRRGRPSAADHHPRGRRPRPGVPQRARPGRPDGRRRHRPGRSRRRGRHHRRRRPSRAQCRGNHTAGADRPESLSDDDRPRRSRPLPGGGQPLPRPGGDDRGRPADLRCRRHAAVGAGDVLHRRRRRAGRRGDGGHPDHPAPIRAAGNGFRGRAAGRRSGARPRRGSASHADRQGRSGGCAHRDRPARLRAEPHARPHRGRAVGAARKRDAGAPVRRRRQPRTAHPAGGDSRLYRTGATQTRRAARRRRARDEPGRIRDRADDPASSRTCCCSRASTPGGRWSANRWT